MLILRMLFTENFGYVSCFLCIYLFVHILINEPLQIPYLAPGTNVYVNASCKAQTLRITPIIPGGLCRYYTSTANHYAEIPNSGITNVNSVFINPSAFAGIFTFTALSRFFPLTKPRRYNGTPVLGPACPIFNSLQRILLGWAVCTTYYKWWSNPAPC